MLPSWGIRCFTRAISAVPYSSGGGGINQRARSPRDRLGGRPRSLLRIASPVCESALQYSGIPPVQYYATRHTPLLLPRSSRVYSIAARQTHTTHSILFRNSSIRSSIREMHQSLPSPVSPDPMLFIFAPDFSRPVSSTSFTLLLQLERILCRRLGPLADAPSSYNLCSR